MAIGSVAVEVVPDAREFWRRFRAATEGEATREGLRQGQEFNRGFRAGSHDIDVKVRADTNGARRDVNRLQNDVRRSSGGMVKNLLALAPAVVPLGAAAAAAGAEFVALGGAAALAFTGARRELELASPVGVQFGAVLSGLKSSLYQLQAVASAGVLSGVQDSAAQLKTELPALSQVVASQSVLLGSTISHLTAGLIGGFSTFQPVLDRVGQSVDNVAARFEEFATGPGGAKFGQSLIDSFNQVAPFIDDLTTSLGRIIAASSGTGSILLTEFGAIARAVTAIPLPVLSALITTLTATRLAILAFRGVAAIQGAIASVGTALDGLRARYSITGLTAQAAAAQTAVANAEAAASAASSAVTQTASAEAAARAYLAEQEAIAASVASSEGALTGLAAAAVRTAETQVEASALAARAAVVQAETTTAAVAEAAAAQQAAAARLAAAQRAASGGFLATLGPIGLVAGALLLLPSLFGGSDDAAQGAAASARDYASALTQTKGAIDDTVRSKAIDSLVGDREELAKANVTLDQAANAVLKGGTAYTTVKNKLAAYAGTSKNAAIDIAGVNDRLLQQRDRFREGSAASKAARDANDKLDTSMAAISRSALNAGTAYSGFAKALTDYNKSSRTAADRGVLIGETLRAANGDAIAYQSTINATAKANQQLVTDFVNLKKGVLDLKTGTLDYHNAAAGPVLSDLQALQDANVKAAAAVYQHFVSTKGGAEAAGNAFNVYKKNTQGALDAVGRKLGLSGEALTKFKNQYFGIKNAGDLKKKIELIGEDRVVDALKGIQEDLDILVGKKPLIPIDADGDPAQHTIGGLQRVIDEIRQNRVPQLTANTAEAQDRINYLQQIIDRLRGKTVYINAVHRDDKGRATVTTGTSSGRVTKNATGGYISGPGTGTSDSIPALLSNGEFVVRATQTKKHRGLLGAINAGVKGFARGGEVGGYSGVDYSGNAGNGASRKRASSGGSGKSKKSGKDIEYTLIGFELDHKKFDTLKEARRAAIKGFRAQVALGLKIDGHDLRAFRVSVKKEAGDVSDAFQDLFEDLKDLGLKGNSPLAKTLAAENRAIQRQVTIRNKTADKLKDTQDAYKALAADAKSAINGAFDVTQAGRGADGDQTVTAGRILTEQKQAAIRVTKFVADIRKLKGKINGTYLRQLIEKGPDALPQAEALLKLNKAQLGSLNTTQATINSQGASLGRFAGETFYRKNLDKYAGELRSENRSINRAVNKLVRQVDRYTDAAANRPVALYADGDKIADIVDNAHHRKSRRNHKKGGR